MTITLPYGMRYLAPGMAQIKDELGVTVRCIPLAPGEPGTCPFTGQPSAKRVVWAKAY